jgi:Fic family protein
MRVVSGADYRRTVHFEAQRSPCIPDEMKNFIDWFNDSTLGGKSRHPTLTSAGIWHLYFVCIHPFEDGNGRIGRALTEKSLAQMLTQPSLLALASTSYPVGPSILLSSDA